MGLKVTAIAVTATTAVGYIALWATSITNTGD